MTTQLPPPWDDDEPQEPAGDSPTELMKLLDLQADLLRSVATGGPRIETVNNQYRRRRRLLDAGLRRHGIDPPFPWGDLWGWYGAWQEQSTTYA